MKNYIKSLFKLSGYEIKKVTNYKQTVQSDQDNRPIGRMDSLLEDLKTRGLKCETVLDVGANNAEWSRMAKNIFPNSSFCLIEPQIEMKEKLESFCYQFNDSVYFLAGAGAKKGILTLTIWDDLKGSSFLPNQDQNSTNEKQQRDIDIITIDDLIDSGKIKKPELLKLDVQGFELEALKGAKKTFGYTEVYILEASLFSFSDLPGAPILSDVINFMSERDYVIYDFPGFLRRPFDGALGQCDICFVKRNGFLRASNVWS